MENINEGYFLRCATILLWNVRTFYGPFHGWFSCMQNYKRNWLEFSFGLNRLIFIHVARSFFTISNISCRLNLKYHQNGIFSIDLVIKMELVVHSNNFLKRDCLDKINNNQRKRNCTKMYQSCTCWADAVCNVNLTMCSCYFHLLPYDQNFCIWDSFIYISGLLGS